MKEAKKLQGKAHGFEHFKNATGENVGSFVKFSFVLSRLWQLKMHQSSVKVSVTL
jgi:hypothetical protein